MFRFTSQLPGRVCAMYSLLSDEVLMDAKARVIGVERE